MPHDLLHCNSDTELLHPPRSRSSGRRWNRHFWTSIFPCGVPSGVGRWLLTREAQPVRKCLPQKAKRCCPCRGTGRHNAGSERQNNVEDRFLLYQQYLYCYVLLVGDIRFKSEWNMHHTLPAGRHTDKNNSGVAFFCKGERRSRHALKATQRLILKQTLTLTPTRMKQKKHA